jgi:hypothetical protein
MGRNFELTPPSRKEDYVFNATLSWEGEEIEKDLKCRLYLPIKLTDPIELYFFPTEEQARKLNGYLLWQYSVDGAITGPAGEVMMQFWAKEVFANKGVQVSYYGNHFADAEMVGYPVYLTITTHILGAVAEPEPISAEVRFWVTPNYLLEPAGGLKRWHTGKVEAENFWQCSVETEPGVTFKFDRRYRYRENDEGETVTYSELTANATLSHAANSEKIFETLRTLDGVLLLASFAARQRSVCLGWDAEDPKRYVRQFVRNRTIPNSSKSATSYRETLIDKLQIQEFMRTAYGPFASFTPQDALRRAISFTVPTKDGTLDSEFVALYTAVEILVLQLRRSTGLEFIVGPDEFKGVRKELKSCIDALTTTVDREKKSLMKQKLSELNRVSFATAFEEFCKYYSVPLTDLWPVVKRDSGASLTDVRNKLVHGEHFGLDQYEALRFAELHLRWTVERMILSVLNWPTDKSNVSPQFLKSWIAYNEWKTKQPSLS